MRGSTFVTLFLLGCSLLLPPPSQAQFNPDKRSEFLRSVDKALAERKYDDALKLIRAAEGESKEVPQAIWGVAKARFRDEKHAETLTLLEEILDKHPDHDVASLAWLGKGQVYSALKDEKNMVASLQRGIDARRVPTRLSIMDAGDTHSWACETLGYHYLQREQWKEALEVFTKWEPSSWCGTCRNSMRSARLHNRLLCLVHLSRHAEAAELGWASVGDPLAAIALVRLYHGSGQLDDLKRMLQKLPDVEGDFAENMKRAIQLAESEMWSEHLSEFESVEEENAEDYGFTIAQHVASWRLLQNANACTEALIRFAEQSKHGHFAKLLAAIDSDETRAALVELAVEGDIYQQQTICGVINARCKNPKELIVQVAKRVPQQRKSYLNRGVDPAPFAQKFYRAWPLPTRSSLPQKLPVPESSDRR